MISFTPMLFRPAKSILFFRLTSLIFSPKNQISEFVQEEINKQQTTLHETKLLRTNDDIVETNVTENIHHGVTVVYVLSLKSQNYNFIKVITEETSRHQFPKFTINRRTLRSCFTVVNCQLSR